MTTPIVNNIAAVETKFLTAMGNGVIATAHFAALIHDAVSSNDSGHIASVVNKLVKKGDANGSRVVRQVFAAIFTGARFAKSKDKKSIVLKMKGVAVDADALARLDGAVKDNLSIRDALVKRVKGEAGAMAKTDADKLAKAYVTATHKRVDGEACTLLENVEAMRMALKALEAELVAST
tara:strand:- start:570 stop:1106 length:537 start_codon:yes stop_codon:yes gene_type:complete